MARNERAAVPGVIRGRPRCFRRRSGALPIRFVHDVLRYAEIVDQYPPDLVLGQQPRLEVLGGEAHLLLADRVNVLTHRRQRARPGGLGKGADDGDERERRRGGALREHVRADRGDQRVHAGLDDHGVADHVAGEVVALGAVDDGQFPGHLRIHPGGLVGQLPGQRDEAPAGNQSADEAAADVDSRVFDREARDDQFRGPVALIEVVYRGRELIRDGHRLSFPVAQMAQFTVFAGGRVQN
jgi:hypothetical protein